MQVASKGAVIQAFKALIWRSGASSSWRTPGLFEYQNNSMKGRPMCCRDWADWARPPFDLRQRRSILMLQSPGSMFKTHHRHAAREKLLRMSAASAWTTDYLSDRNRLARLGLRLWGGDQQQRSPSGERPPSPFLFTPYTSDSQSRHL